MKLLFVDSDSCASSETEQQQLLLQSTWTKSTIVFELGALADNWRSTTEWTNATALRTIKVVVALIMTKPFSQNAATYSSTFSNDQKNPPATISRWL